MRHCYFKSKYDLLHDVSLVQIIQISFMKSNDVRLSVGVNEHFIISFEDKFNYNNSD